MPKRLQIALAVVLVALAGTSAWQGLRLREPVYHGKPLSVWLNAYTMSGQAGVETWQVREAQQQADEAVRRTGTNALPTLLRMLRAKDSALKLRVLGLVEWQHLIKIQHTPAQELNYRASWAFSVLRAKAQNAVPVLIEIANENVSHESQCYAIGALGSVGPPAKVAVPFLLGWMTNADSMVRYYAVRALHGIHAESSPVLPALISALRDPVPQVRTAALLALQDLGPNAKPAFGVVTGILTNAQYDIERTCAASALRAMDPEAAARAGVQ